MSEQEQPHRVQIAFEPSIWNDIISLGYMGSVTSTTNQMWKDRLAKEQGNEISGDENRLKSLQKKLGDAHSSRLKLLRDIDPECPANTSIKERPVLVRFAKAFVAAGGHLGSPSDIVNHRIKADFFKKIREAESKGGSEKVLSQRLHLFIDFLLTENDVLQLERRISAPPEPSKPSLEVGGKNFAEFTEERPVFAPAVEPTNPQVAAEKPIEPGAMERLKDILYEGPGGIDFSKSAPRESSSDKK